MIVAVVDFLFEAAQSSPVPAVAAAAALVASAVVAPEKEEEEASLMKAVALKPW